MIVLRYPSFAHFKLRALEWYISAMLFAVGVTLLHPFPTLSEPVFGVMVDLAPESFWAWACVGVSLLRLTALYINGAWHQTPWIRMLTAVMSSLIWLQLALSVIGQPIVNLGSPIFLGFIAADWYSIWRAANDAHDNRKKRELPIVA